MKVLTHETITNLKEGEEVIVIDPQSKKEHVCIFYQNSNLGIFFTTKDSRVDEFDAASYKDDEFYSDYIHHVRSNITRYALMSIEEFIELLKTQNYYIG